MSNEPGRPTTITVAAPPTVVADAVSGPQGLSSWLADQARSEKREGGRVSLWWHDGRQAAGRWVSYQAPSSLVLRARFDDQPAFATATFELAPVENDGLEATTLSATVSADSTADGEAWDKIWRHALDDIKLFCETGESGRYLRRPMMGIHLEEVEEETAAAKGLAVNKGILVTSTVDDGGAAKAGVVAGDVLVALGGRPLTDWASVGSALDGFSAGDKVPVRLWRGTDEHTLEVALGGRPRTEPVVDAAALADRLSESHERVAQRLRELLDGASEAQAGFTPAEGEWSVKCVLLHMSDSEHWFWDDIARVAADETSTDWAPKSYSIRERAVATVPVARLSERLHSEMAEGRALARHLLSQDKPSAVVLHQLAESITWSPDHLDEHAGQIEANLKAAREAGID